MIQFSADGMLALLAFVMCWGLAAVLFQVGAAGSIARKLSLLLVVEGATMISTGYLDRLSRLVHD